MKKRNLFYDQAARDGLKQGIDALSKMVKVTLGPLGNNVIIEKMSGSPLITKDGVSVAKEIFLEDPVQNIGAQLLKEVASKTNETAGDGTTTATVLAHAIMTEGIKNITSGANPMDIKRGIDLATKKVITELIQMSRPVVSKQEIINVASISANNDLEIGNYIADAIEKAGNEGTVIVENAKGVNTIIETTEGLQVDRGYQSPYFINKVQTMEVELNNVYILLYNGKLTQVDALARLLNSTLSDARGNASFLIIADEFSNEVLQTLVYNKSKGVIQCCAITSPAFGDKRVDLMHDIAVMTKGTVLGTDMSIPLSQATSTSLGFAEKILCDKNKTIIVSGAGIPEKIKERVDQIRMLISGVSTEYDKQRLQERLGKMTGGIVVLKVGAATETELAEKKLRIEDALHATRAALDEGIVPGGGCALVRARRVLDDYECSAEFFSLRKDQRTGVTIIKDSLQVPFLSICDNAGLTSGVMLRDLEKEENFNVGFDILNGNKLGDMFELGVIDPTKVVRLSLENAASVAGMLLTTKGVISHSKEEKEYTDRLLLQTAVQ